VERSATAPTAPSTPRRVADDDAADVEGNPVDCQRVEHVLGSLVENAIKLDEGAS
jgi:hypothetical protein